VSGGLRSCQLGVAGRFDGDLCALPEVPERVVEEAATTHNEQVALPDSERSYHELTLAHLQRLARFVSMAHTEMGQRRADLKGQLMGACLAQGAAAHFVDRSTGVKDFDLWLFYRQEFLQRHVQVRGRCIVYDFGPSPFGRHPDDPLRFRGRRVDVMCRELPRQAPGEPAEAVLAWLNGSTESARQLRQRPIVMVWPRQQLGHVIWNPTTHPAPPSTSRNTVGPKARKDADEANRAATARLWRLRAWDDPDLHEEWRQQQIISMSADEAGDLNEWPGEEDLRERLNRALPGRTSHAIGMFVTYWRYFRVDMAPGDRVIIPLADRRAGLVKVVGDYRYMQRQADMRLRHQRQVQWLQILDRSDLPPRVRAIVNAPSPCAA
jgi:hypothetical protein